MAFQKNLIKEFRLKVGLSQNELAKKLGYKNGQFISNVERDIAAFPVERYWDLNKVLGVPMQRFVEYKLKDYEKDLRQVIARNK